MKSIAVLMPIFCCSAVRPSEDDLEKSLVLHNATFYSNRRKSLEASEGRIRERIRTHIQTYTRENVIDIILFRDVCRLPSCCCPSRGMEILF